MVMELRKRKPAAEPATAPAPKKKNTPKATTPKATTSKTAAPKAVEGKKPANKRGLKAKAEDKEAKDSDENKEDEKKEDEKKEDEKKEDEKKEVEKKEDEAKADEVKDAKDDKDAEIKEGYVLSPDGFGGEILTNDGTTTTLKALVEESKSGVAIFTYPRASTPGCTTQACLFRDAYSKITDAGLAVYGLSTDSPKANTTFKDKKELPYPLLCDASASLIGALGFKKAPRGTVRGVVVIDKAWHVVVHTAGGPAATLAAVEAVLGQF